MLFIPVWDKNPLKTVRFQYATLALISINILIHIVFRSGWLPQFDLSDFDLVPWAVVPERIMTSAVFAPSWDWGQLFYQLPSGRTLITYQFLHNDAWHLITNMIFLWVFGDNVEDAMGHVKYVLFFLLCGVFGALAQCFAMPHGDSLLIGASGSVSGIIAAYLMLYPFAPIWVLIPFKIPILLPIPVRLNALFILGAWILIQIGYLLSGYASDVSWWTHIGGFIAGALLVLVMRRPGVLLFKGQPPA
jgi:membrane associated rhomboid family serine protease